MLMSNLRGLTVGMVLLVGTACAVTFPNDGAMARVGVTGATEGDPRGIPPTQAERVLYVGTDIQAQEVITTGSDDRAHVIFLDGSTITIGPNSRITIDRYVYDPNTQKGELSLTASKGVLRVIGGKISKSQAINVSTPSASMGIRGGILIVDVEPTQTTSYFVFGDSMTVDANGQTQTTTKPGRQVVTPHGGGPGAPTLILQGSLNAALAALDGVPGGTKALSTAISSIVDSKLNNQQMMTQLTNLLQSIINQYAPTTVGTTTSNLDLAVLPINNPGQQLTQQTAGSPN
jgi:hypothetical protein